MLPCKYVIWMMLVCAIVGLSSMPLHAQDSLWADHYGGSYNETGNSCLILSNGDRIVLGSTYSYGAGDHDIYLLRIDSSGNLIWSRTYGGTGTEYGNDIRQTSDGGFAITGSTTSYKSRI